MAVLAICKNEEDPVNDEGVSKILYHPSFYFCPSYLQE